MSMALASFLVASIVAVTPDEPAHLRARVDLPPGASDAVLTVEQIAPGPPDQLVLEWAGGSVDVFLNDERIAHDRAVHASDATRVLRLDDVAATARAWHENGPNVVRMTGGTGGGVGWARLRVGSGLGSTPLCLFDVGGQGCRGERLRPGDGIRGEFEISATLDPGAGTIARIRVPYTVSDPPAELDLSGLEDGPYALCVTTVAGTECAAFTLDGESSLLLGSAGNHPPVADAGISGATECTSPQGASVVLDGSASSDADSTEAASDIAYYEWFRDFGTPRQAWLGSGPQVAVTLPLGSHVLTLRVTDWSGATDTADVQRSVVDTTAPVIRVLTSPYYLWPADHRMVAVTAEPVVYDACGTTTSVLNSLYSNEPDDAPGDADGTTSGDIQGAEVGTNDRTFSLRAETGAVFGGRRYVAHFTTVDASGNRGIGRGVFAVKQRTKIAAPVDSGDK